MTDAIKAAIGETTRRRDKQLAYNKEHNITPTGINKRIKDIIEGVPYHQKKSRKGGKEAKQPLYVAEEMERYSAMPADTLSKQLNKLEKQMHQHARDLEFEQAAALRDKIKAIEGRIFGIASNQAGI